MEEVKNKNDTPGFWRRNWLTLAIICMLCWTGIYFWHDILLISPFLIIIHSFLLYLFVVKFIYDNRSPFEILLTELREGGWILIKAIGHPGIIIWQKCTTGMDLLTQRLGVEQELVIAEKRRKTLEIELSQRRLHELLAKTTCILPDSTLQQMASEEKVKERSLLSSKRKQTEQVPPYAKYAPVLMEYLEQVHWEKFTVTQAQLILHKRFGTVKLVLEELVYQQKLEYVTTGKRIAYRPVTKKKD